MSHRPELVSANDRVEESEQLRVQAGLKPNPRLILQSEDLRPASPFVFGRNAESYAYLNQNFELEGKRQKRVELASQTAGITRAESELLRRQIARNVLEAYWRTESAERARDLYGESAEYFQQAIDYHEARFKEGKLAEVDLMRVRLEGQRVRAAAAEAQLEVERAILALSREMATSPVQTWSLDEDFEALHDATNIPPGSDVATWRPEGKIAIQAISQAKANLALQRANGRPDLNGLLGYKRNGSLDTAIIGLQLDLPFFNRNQGAVGAAEASVRAAEQDLSSARIQLNYEEELAKREFALRLDQCQNIFKPLLEQATQISDVSRAVYREGGLDLVRMLDAERVRIDAQLSWVNALAAYHQSFVEFEYAEGVEP